MSLSLCVLILITLLVFISVILLAFRRPAHPSYITTGMYAWMTMIILAGIERFIFGVVQANLANPRDWMVAESMLTLLVLIPAAIAGFYFVKAWNPKTTMPSPENTPETLQQKLLVPDPFNHKNTSK